MQVGQAGAALAMYFNTDLRLNGGLLGFLDIALSSNMFRVQSLETLFGMPVVCRVFRPAKQQDGDGGRP